MGEVSSENEISVFRGAILDENVSIQVDAIKRLPLLALAIDIERTREELIPCIKNCVDAMGDELCFHLAEQLEKFVPLIGGNDHVGILLDILIKLASEDEIIVRDRAIETMRNICNSLDKEQCEKSFYPMINNLVASEWFTTKCSASCLITISYSKMSQEKQDELRNHIRNLIQDNSPMVRKSTATSLIEFIDLLNVEEIISGFVPVFDNLAQDDQDSIKTLSVDVGIAISKKLKDFEIYEYLLKTFKLLGVDESWRVRQRIACRIHEIQGSEKNRDEILSIYKGCVRDEESEVRVHAAKNIYNFSVTLLDSYRSRPASQEAFEKNFEENITSEIHYLITDLNEDVLVALSSNILNLSSILTNECFNRNILPLVVDALEKEHFMPFKENMLKNLNSLPVDVDITKYIKSIKHVIKNLLENSQMHWRTRRNLLLAFTHITKNSTSDYFDENLKIFYQYLLNDPIFAIRRSAPLILPLLVKQFGCDWARKSLLSMFITLSRDERYLYRYCFIYGVQELIQPTLDPPVDTKEKYLVDLKHLILKSEQPKKYLEILTKIIKLNQRLATELQDNEILEDDIQYCNDDISFYAQDTLENLKEAQKNPIFAFDNDNHYLESVLLILIKDFVDVIKDLIGDPIKNVQDRAKIALRDIRNFSLAIKEEIDQAWVDEVLEKLTQEDLDRIEEELNSKLAKDDPQEEEEEEEEVMETETINCDLNEDESMSGANQEKID